MPYSPNIIRHNACIPSFPETICGYYEKKLLGDLMRPYNYLERPVVNESEPLMLTFGITLQQIIDVVSLFAAPCTSTNERYKGLAHMASAAKL